VINYTETPGWDEKARELTDGRGVDCVVEIGGPGTIAMSLKAVAVGGHISLIGGNLSPSGMGLDPLLLTGRGIALGSISVGSRTDFEAMNRAIAMHRLHPRNRPDLPVRRGQGGLPAFRGPRTFWEGRHHTSLTISASTVINS
jgi:NADPH:quinone reductase-like Zn-dependent oxidoreductase